jgi:BirA family transcriptional regulator, biotin operon repressor / biotin---[acetyl-CoA-carboxylase] ligase
MSIPFIEYSKSHKLDSIDSTNTYCKSGNVQFGEWVLADHQTKGRGRKDKEWESLGKGNILFSARVNFNTSVFQNIPHLSLLVGGSILRSLKMVSKNPDELRLKWPNDIYKQNKKIAGTLIEAEILGSNIDLIIGIGINLFQNLSKGKESLYGTLYETESSIEDRENLLQILIGNLNITFQRIYSGEMNKEISWIESNSYLHGKSVQANVDGTLLVGEVIGFDKNGYLLINNHGRIYSLPDTDPEFRILDEQ